MIWIPGRFITQEEVEKSEREERERAAEREKFIDYKHLENNIKEHYKKWDIKVMNLPDSIDDLLCLFSNEEYEKTFVLRRKVVIEQKVADLKKLADELIEEARMIIDMFEEMENYLTKKIIARGLTPTKYERY